MSLNNKYTSIALGVVIAGLVIYQIQAQNTYEDEISLLRKSQTASLQISQDTIAQLQKTVATLNSQLSAAQSQSANQGTVAGNSSSATAPAVANAPPQNIQERIRGIMGSPEMRQATSKMMSKMMVNNTYGDFIRGLHLSAAEKESLSQIFANAAEQKTDLQLKVAAGQMSQAEYAAAAKDIDGKLRESLSGYLYKEEMTAFDQYEATKDTRAATKALQARESDLERNAPGLSADSRKYVAKILTDETAKIRPQSGILLAGAGGQNPISANGVMTQPLDNALQKIKTDGTLDKTQMSALEDYVTQQKDMMESITRLAPALQGR